MPLQPHAQQLVDEQVTLLARAFKAGFKSAGPDKMFCEYEDFVKFLETIDIVTAYYARQELFDEAS